MRLYDVSGWYCSVDVDLAVSCSMSRPSLTNDKAASTVVNVVGRTEYSEERICIGRYTTTASIGGVLTPIYTVTTVTVAGVLGLFRAIWSVKSLLYDVADGTNECKYSV